MKIVVASDSFKGCLSSSEVADAVESGIRRQLPEADVVKFSVADGGEGTAEVITEVLGGERRYCTIHDPIGRKVKSCFGIVNVGGKKIGVMDIASSCGLIMLDENERNVMKISSRGVGEMLLEVIKEGCEEVYVGLGGSANCDAGAGMLESLGVKFYDNEGRMAHPCGGNIKDIDRIDFSGINPSLKKFKIRLMSDVDNPLCGENGAAVIFAPQKGASPEDVLILEKGICHFIQLIAETIPQLRNGGEKNINSVSLLPGAGAAGGLGWAFMQFMDCYAESGISALLELTDFSQSLTGTSFVITGEGKLDCQTLRGKVPFGVMQEARKKNIPVIALAGRVENPEELLAAGFSGVFSIASGPMSLEDSMQKDVAIRSIESVSESITSFAAGLCRINVT